MPDYEDHNAVVGIVTAAQDADTDIREQVREATLFVTKRDGQWEPYWWSQNENQPRYTFDLTNPIIDSIVGEMLLMDFDIKVKPAGGDASKDTAKILDGLIRNIENISNGSQVYASAIRDMVTSGMAGFRVATKYVNDDSFDQDLVLEPLHNFEDRVWFDPSAEEQDKSDAKWGVNIIEMSPDEYKERWPEGSEQSVSSDIDSTAYYNKVESIKVSEFFYIKEESRDLVLMSNGQVFEDDEEFKKVSDDLAKLQVVEQERRSRPKNVVYVRLYDASGWLTEPKKTVFDYIPLIPMYANYRIIEGKVTCWGAVEKIIDHQRTINYTMSRMIAEGALAPRAKYWMTEKQADGHTEELGTLNVNNDAVQLYNPDGEAPPPVQTGGAQINPGLQLMSSTMVQMISQSAGQFQASMGDNPNAQSGVAIAQLQDKGDTSNVKYVRSAEVALCHAAKILIGAIPKIYLEGRVTRILNQDGSYEMATLNDTVPDQQTGEMVTLNDLNKGIYDVTCSAGPAFKNRQDETVAAIIEIAQVNPQTMQIGSDIMLANMDAPGMEDIAARDRAMKLQQGLIPFDQMTDEEKQAAQQAAQNQQRQEDPNMLIGRAELMKAENEQTKTQIDTQVKAAQLQMDQQKLELQNQELQFKLQQAQSNAGLDREKFEAEMMLKMKAQMEAVQNDFVKNLNTQADTYKKLQEAEESERLVAQQAAVVSESQSDQQ